MGRGRRIGHFVVSYRRIEKSIALCGGDVFSSDVVGYELESAEANGLSPFDTSHGHTAGKNR